MSDLQSTLDAIDRALIECDARTLPPLTTEAAAAVLDLIDQTGLQLTEWQRDLVVATNDLPPDTEPMRGWLSRWFRRHR